VNPTLSTPTIERKEVRIDVITEFFLSPGSRGRHS